MALTVAACGPESTTATNEQLTADTVRIAQEYVASNNLEQARSQLAALAVANANQWLLFVTESEIRQQGDANALAALVKLTTDLGLASALITDYAAQHNLLPAPAQVAEAAPVVQAEPVVVAQAAEAAPADAVGAAVEELPAEEPAPVEPTPEPTPEPTSTPEPPMAQASDLLNVRGGPGTNYNLTASLQKDEQVQIVGKNPAGDWWQIQLANGQQGWVLGQLVQTRGDTAAVAVATDIPAAPAQPPAPAPAAVAEAPAPEAAPEEASPQEAAPEEAAAEEAPPPADPNAPPYFTLVSKRLWNKEENDGCVGKHLLRINVLDANGVRINGVRLKGIYTGYELVTGDQGKGDGVIEFDLHGAGEGFTVIRNDDGREAGSDRAEGFTTRSIDIDQATLIATGYCTNDDDCRIFYDSWGCHGHHSWEATFQRNY